MNESKLAPSRANMYVQLGAQLSSGIAPHASASNYIVGQLHTERTRLTREQIAARCRRERREAGLPVYEAPRVSAREVAPSQRQSLLQQANSLASGLRSVAEAVFEAVVPRFPGAAASGLGGKGTGDYAAPIEKSASWPRDGIVDEFAELAESLGLHASYSHQFTPLDSSEPARSAGWAVMPSFDPATLSVDDLLVLLESSQPDDQGQAEQLETMLSFLLKKGMRVFTATPDVLDTLPCSTVADCVPVRSLCDGKVLLDTVLGAAPGKGNVVILPPDAIESLANMISPAYRNATDDFVWVTPSPMRALGPQYRLNCKALPATGQVGPQTGSSWADNEKRSALYGFAIGAGGVVLGVVLGAAVFLRRNAADPAASVTQRIPRQIGNTDMEYKRDHSRKNQNNDEAKDDAEYRMKDIKKDTMQNAPEDNPQDPPLKEITSSDADE